MFTTRLSHFNHSRLEVSFERIIGWCWAKMTAACVGDIWGAEIVAQLSPAAKAIGKVKVLYR